MASKKKRGGVERHSPSEIAKDRALEEVRRHTRMERYQHDAREIEFVQPLHGAVTEFVAKNALSTARAVSSLVGDETELKVVYDIYEPFHERSKMRVWNSGL